MLGNCHCCGEFNFGKIGISKFIQSVDGVLKLLKHFFFDIEIGVYANTTGTPHCKWF
jgi:hypothetical protein